MSDRYSAAMAAPNTLDELGYYLLAGGPSDPSVVLEEARQGEELGLGTAFLSERFNIKELGALSGAACAVTSTMRIALATTNHNLRHPIVFASWATTLHRLSGGRFMPGIGRGIVPLQQAYGIPPITTAQMEDFVGLMRRLWHGEVIFGHDGPAGSWPMPASMRTSPCVSWPLGPNHSLSAAVHSMPSCCTRSSARRPCNDPWRQ